MRDSSFPKDDETYLKVAPVMLGADAQKQNSFPNSVWPGTIPGHASRSGLRYNTFFQFTGANRNQFNSLAAPGTRTAE